MGEPVQGQDLEQPGDVELAFLLAAARQYVHRQVDRFPAQRTVRIEKDEEAAQAGIDAYDCHFPFSREDLSAPVTTASALCSIPTPCMPARSAARTISNEPAKGSSSIPPGTA